jgi:hypothetical protein
LAQEKEMAEVTLDLLEQVLASRPN